MRIDDANFTDMVDQARLHRLEFESVSGKPGALQKLYAAIDSLDAFVKDSRFMRHRDLIDEERRALARVFLNHIARVPEDDRYLAGICGVLLKVEIEDLAAREPEADRQLATFRDTIKGDSRTDVLLRALNEQRDEIHRQAG